MTDAPTAALNVAMVGHGFMGAAHSQAFRVAPRFFDLPLSPVMSTLVGRNVEATAKAAEKWGWQKTANDWRDGRRRPVDRPDRHLLARVDPRRDRRRGPRGRQARALREAARQHGRRGRADGRRRGEGRREGRVRDGRLHLPPRARDHLRPRPRRPGPPRRDPPHPGQLPPRLACRRRRPDDLASRQGEGRIRLPRRHRSPRHRRGPVHHRPDARERVGPPPHLRHRAPPPRRERRADEPRRRRERRARPGDGRRLGSLHRPS